LRTDVLFIRAQSTIRADGLPAAQARRQQFEASADVGEQPLRAGRTNCDLGLNG